MDAQKQRASTRRKPPSAPIHPAWIAAAGRSTELTPEDRLLYVIKNHPENQMTTAEKNTLTGLIGDRDLDRTLDFDLAPPMPREKEEADERPGPVPATRPTLPNFRKGSTRERVYRFLLTNRDASDRDIEEELSQQRRVDPLLDDPESFSDMCTAVRRAMRKAGIPCNPPGRRQPSNTRHS